MACVYLGTVPAHVAGNSVGTDWLELTAGVTTTAKDPKTGREGNFVGPGRARACVDYELESWLAPSPTGDVVFTSVIGGGEAPGNEEWIMTPLGAVRYASARMEIRASSQRVQINVGVGTAYVWTEQREREKKEGGASSGSEGGAPHPSAAFDPRANDAGIEGGWVRLDKGATVVVTPAAPASPEAAAQAAVDRCAALAADARAIAREFGAPDAALGELAVRHVVARRVARAACGIARVRAESLAPSDKATALASAALAGDATWRGLGQ
jgi:hypothetical protein